MTATSTEYSDEASGETSPKDGSRRLGLTILAIILLLAGGLALKAWDEYRHSRASHLTSVQLHTQSAASQLSGRINAVGAALDVARASETSDALSKAKLSGVNAIVYMSEAKNAQTDSTLSHAAEAATFAIENNHRAAMTVHGDIVVVSGQASGRTLLAIIPSTAWLDTAEAKSFSVLRGNGVVQVGDASLSNGVAELRPGRAQIVGSITAPIGQACAFVSGSAMSICTARAIPAFSLNDLIKLLAYGLLFAAPVLAIVGLMNRMNAPAEDDEFEVASEDGFKLDPLTRRTLEGADAGYWEWSTTDNSVWLNPNAAKLLGSVGTGNIPLTTFMSFVHQNHQQRVTGLMNKAISTGHLNCSFLSTGSTPRWIELRGSLIDPNNPDRHFSGIALDVSQSKKLEDRAKAAERRLRAAVEGYNGPFALWDSRRRILFWNRAFALDFGLQDTLRPGMSQDTVIIARAGAVRSEKQSGEDRRTTVIALKDGRWIQMVERMTPDGGLITVGVDVSDTVKKEEELIKQRSKMKKAMEDLEISEGRADALARKFNQEKRKAEKAANTKSAFLANMSHELRTPLNAINGFSEILATELYGELGDKRYKGYAQDILTSGQHLLDMINDILDMAKIEAGKMTISPQPIDPVDPVDAAVRMVRRKAADKGVDLVLEPEENLPDIDADHRAIRQMILNLVSNAIKFTPAEGKITVAVERRGPEVYFGVTDTGIGIPAEDLPRLARPFEQVEGSKDMNAQGTGLGLALTKSFAEMHGGRMVISSVEGEGTTVAFSLPIKSPNKIETERDAAAFSRQTAS